MKDEARAGDRWLVLCLALGLVLPVTGWVAGGTNGDRFASSDAYLEALTGGYAAQTFAVPFAVSIVINTFLWARRPRGTTTMSLATAATTTSTSTSTRRIRSAIAAVDLAGLAWVGSLLLPASWQYYVGLVSGVLIAIFSIVLCVLLVHVRRLLRLAAPPALRAIHDTERKGRRKKDLRVAAAALAVAAAAGLFVTTVPSGSYPRCAVMGKSYYGAGHIEVNTRNCGDFALRGSTAVYTSIDEIATYSFTTRGYSLFPWEPKIVTMIRVD